MKGSTYAVSARDRRFYAPLLLGVLVCLAYAPSLPGEFLLDDENYIVANSALSRPSRWPRFFYDPGALTADASQSRMMYRPVTALSFALDRAVGGADPFWYHLTSVLLHAANTGLLFVAAEGLFGATAPAWAAAAFFGLHPVQVEAVAYISGSRATVLSLFFCLIAFLLYRSRRAYGAAACGVFALAMLSKESSAFLLPVLAAHDLVFLPREKVYVLSRGTARQMRAVPREEVDVLSLALIRRQGPGERGTPCSWSRGTARQMRAVSREKVDWKALAARWLPFALVLAAYAAVRRLVLGRTAQRGLWGRSLGEHLGLSVHGLFREVTNAVWPARLKACYSFPEGPGFAIASIFMAAVLLALCGVAFLLLRRRRPEGFALAWFLAALAPVANVVPVDALAADRFLYAPAAGLGLLWGAVLSVLAPRWICAVAAAMSVLLGARAAEQELAWRSPLALDLAAYAAEPEDPCAALNLSSHYYNWGMLGRAESLASLALREPTPAHLRPPALMTMALIRMKAGRFREARAWLRAVPAEDPAQAEARRLLGLCAPMPGDRRRGRGGVQGGARPSRPRLGG